MPPHAIPWSQLVPGWLAVASLLLGLYLWQRRSGDATAVDLGWTLGIGICGVGFAIGGTGQPLHRWLAGATAALWSARLAWHLLRDRVRSGRGEDGRYRALRARWGPRAQLHFAWFYQAQAALAVLFAVPFLLLASNPAPRLAGVQIAGLTLVLLGVATETLADRQLSRHRADPGNRGRTCRRGLWALSRHPNYFGEWLCWLGIALLALPSPHGWLALLAPALLYLLVRFVTGIPPSELQALKSRGDDYRAYQETTNAFFPWPPRRQRQET